MSRRPPYAVFSCDVDTVDRHLQGYGFEGEPPCDLVYRTAVPRIVELLEELKVPGVFFIIGRDAEAQSSLLRDLVHRGHEVASHSLTHPQPFRTLDDAALREELVTSRGRLSAASGKEVVGFRAPAWDADARVLRQVGTAGYRYDASVFPTPALIASRLAAYSRSTGMRSILSMGIFDHAFKPTRPHALVPGKGGLVEFPIAVTSWLRLPVYHTISYLTPAWAFRRALRAALRSGRPLCYEFHAADLLDLKGDEVDPRLSRHPGMQVSLGEKRASLKAILQTIVQSVERVTTYREALAAQEAA